MRVVLLTYGSRGDVEPMLGLAPHLPSLSAALGTALALGTRTRATAVAGVIRTDGAAVAGNLLFDTVGGARAPAST